LNIGAAYIQTFNEDKYTVDVFIDPINKRVRIEDYRGDISSILSKIEEVTSKVGAEKLIFICRSEHFIALQEYGLQCEAIVDHFYRGSHAYYFTKYYQEERRNSQHWLMEDQILEHVKQLSRATKKVQAPDHYKLMKVNKGDVEKLAELYKRVFQIYPTPLHDPEYISKTIDQGTIYYAFSNDGEMVSAASAEVNQRYFNAELTDCATLLAHRKFGLMKILLEKLEEELIQNGLYCSYSIARAQSFGMNAVLHQLGYHYRGRLTNNCYIYEALEDMNMWVKNLSGNELTRCD
jgi:beta-lysine N6-acetyltransferase